MERNILDTNSIVLFARFNGAEIEYLSVGMVRFLCTKLRLVVHLLEFFKLLTQPIVFQLQVHQFLPHFDKFFSQIVVFLLAALQQLLFTLYLFEIVFFFLAVLCSQYLPLRFKGSPNVPLRGDRPSVGFQLAILIFTGPLRRYQHWLIWSLFFKLANFSQKSIDLSLLIFQVFYQRKVDRDCHLQLCFVEISLPFALNNLCPLRLFLQNSHILANRLKLFIEEPVPAIGRSHLGGGFLVDCMFNRLFVWH